MKNIIISIANYSTTWLLLVFGMILSYQYIDNLAIFYFWFIGIIAVVALPAAIFSSTFVETFREYNKAQTKLGQNLNYINYLLLTLVSASFGLYWLTTVFTIYLATAYMVYLPETKPKQWGDIE